MYFRKDRHIGRLRWAITSTEPIADSHLTRCQRRANTCKYIFDLGDTSMCTLGKGQMKCKYISTHEKGEIIFYILVWYRIHLRRIPQRHVFPKSTVLEEIYYIWESSTLVLIIMNIDIFPIRQLLNLEYNNIKTIWYIFSYAI